jgi:hypothetical protein
VFKGRDLVHQQNFSGIIRCFFSTGLIENALGDQRGLQGQNWADGL